jgi:hypothetical protein
MYKSTTKCNETLGKWCKNKHGASKIIDTFETYHQLRDMQKFAGCLASLSRFVSRLGEKAMPLCQLMKKTDHFVWS